MVLMDIQMPVLDGIQATVAIREIERDTCHHTPIIALTAHALREEKTRIMNKGVDGYVTKPIDLMLLFKEIKRCIEPRREIITSACNDFILSVK